MKKLVMFDPETHKATTLAKIKMVGGKVVFEPKDAPKEHTMLKSIPVKGKLLVPADGKEYFKALDRLRGTYYAVKEIKKSDESKPVGTKEETADSEE